MCIRTTFGWMGLVVVTLLATVFMGCDSPIMEHATAQTPAGAPSAAPGNSPIRTEDAFECPLSFPRQRMCAELSWNGIPNSQDPSSFTLRFWKSGAATHHGPYSNPPNEVFVKLWMPSMGHGSSPITTVQSHDSGHQSIPGVYEGSNVYFIMSGAWEVHVQLRSGSKVQEESIANVNI